MVCFLIKNLQADRVIQYRLRSANQTTGIHLIKIVIPAGLHYGILKNFDQFHIRKLPDGEIIKTVKTVRRFVIK